MSRLVLCLRVSDRPVPHVPSVQLTCRTCQQPVWREEGATEEGDEVSCTVCHPHPVLEAMRALRRLIEGSTPDAVTDSVKGPSKGTN